ncbi:MAG: hypothetical protein ACR2QO_00415 [Acidimicrobiales bacterium]
MTVSDDLLPTHGPATNGTTDQGYASADDESVDRGRYRVPSFLLLVGVLATLIGVSSTWYSEDPTLRRLLDGPTYGWIPLLSSNRDVDVALVAEDGATADMFRDRIFDPDADFSTLAVKPPYPQRITNRVFYKLTWFL